MSDITKDFLNECSNCGQCRTVCPFLEKHGEPDEILKNDPGLAFLCTNCTGCDKRCPLDLSASSAMFDTKQRLIKEQKVPAKATSAMDGARRFAERGHKPPFTRYDRTKTSFWPGCSLAGTNPEAVKRTAEQLSEIDGEKVGLSLDCCFDPLYQMGDIEPVKGAVENIKERLSEAGIENLIVGCANCKKVFDRHMGDVNVEYVLEALPDDVLDNVPEGDHYLHYPCPFYHVDGLRERAQKIMGSAIKGDLDEQKIPACCGLGGSLNNQDEELSAKFTERVTMEAFGAYIVTACMGCKNTFINKGTNTYHILELLSGVKPKERAVGAVKKWGNRLALARGK